MRDPLVSVMMITFNHAPYIEKAIDCILAQQSIFSFELVIGEDCSTDGTREIVFQYAERFPNIIRVITSDTNVGMKKNSLRTIHACRGKYIAWCEGDDYWHRIDKLQLQVSYLEDHPECGLVYSDYDIYDTQSQRTNFSHVKKRGKNKIRYPNIVDIVKGDTLILTLTVVARRDLVILLQSKDPFLHLGDNFKMGDTQMWAEISANSSCYFIDESLATRQLLQESATRSTSKSKELEFKKSNAEMCLYICKKYKLPGFIHKIYSDIWRRKSLQLAFLNQNQDLAKQIKQHESNFNLKDKIWYFGTIIPPFGKIIRIYKKFF